MRRKVKSKGCNGLARSRIRCRPCTRLDSRALLCCLPILLTLLSRSDARYSGGDGTRETPYLMASAQDLVALTQEPDDWSAHFRLATDVDMADVPADAFLAIGDRMLPFSGVFDGAEREIRNLLCIRNGCDDVGLFGCIRGSLAEVRNLRLIDPNVHGDGENIGALVGQLRSGIVRGCRIEGARVFGHIAVGGLVGWNQGAILDCEVSGEITGAFSVGGLAGVNFWGEGTRRCRVNATVSGVNRVGGLVGGCTLAEIRWCCSTGHVQALSNVGGFIGAAEGAILGSCYSTASVRGSDMVGGLIGSHGPSCKCSSGSRPGDLACCYAAGAVSGESETGGLVGLSEDSTVADSFWDVEISGQATSDGGIGCTTTELRNAVLFMNARWPLTGAEQPHEFWVLKSGYYPRFAWEDIVGDFDGDDDVDLRDFRHLACRWRSPDESFWTGGTDLTGDGRIDLRDLKALSDGWLRDR